MWRNGRRNGLKIEVLPVSRLFTAHQIDGVFPGKLCKFLILAPRVLGRAEKLSLLHKFLHNSLAISRPASGYYLGALRTAGEFNKASSAHAGANSGHDVDISFQRGRGIVSLPSDARFRLDRRNERPED